MIYVQINDDKKNEFLQNHMHSDSCSNRMEDILLHRHLVHWTELDESKHYFANAVYHWEVEGRYFEARVNHEQVREARCRNI